MTLLSFLGSSENLLYFMWFPVVIACFFSAATIRYAALHYYRKSKLPYANPTKTFGLRITQKREYYKNGMELISACKKSFLDKPYRLLTFLGEVVVLPAHYGGVIHNDSRLSFRKAVKSDFQAHLAGFQPFGIVDHPTEMFQNLIKKHLTKYLNTVTVPLSEEATFAVDHLFSSSPDWQTVNLQETMLSLVARLSSRVFLGEELCRNDDWLATTTTYSVYAFNASINLLAVPEFLKPLVTYFNDDCRKVRTMLQRAREIVEPVLAKRRALKEQARANKEPIPQFNDAMDWAEAEHRGSYYDPAEMQLALSFTAIHTTTDLLCQTMLCLANDPSQFTPLRQEMIEVLSKEGWKKTSLYNMKLLDSAIKEAQRLKPLGKLQLRRIALEDVTLEGDVKICKGERVQVDMSPMWDPSTYPNPESYDMYHFLRMRDESDSATIAQLVTTRPDFLAFGHGKYACPGRFFASNEIKLAICHLLLKYEWRLGPGTTPAPISTGHTLQINPKAQLQFKRRKEEINLEDLEALVEGN